MSALRQEGDAQGTVFITGGSSGIGRCTGALFGRRGWNVGLIARGETGLRDAQSDIRRYPIRCEVETADVSDAASLEHAAERLAAAIGVPDIWINCAGNGVYGQFTSVTPEEFDRVTAVTYGGTVNGCRIALGMMMPRRRGTIVNVCSATAFHGLPLMTSYSGAKSAVRGFAQSLRAELRIARSPVKVCVVFPPAVNTPFFSHAVSHMGFPARPAPPVYQPEVVAAGIYFTARLGVAEMPISGTAAVFSLASRLSPALIAFAMTRLGFEGQLTRDPEAARLEAPTLFAPSGQASPVHGPFGSRARRGSFHLRLVRAVSLPLSLLKGHLMTRRGSPAPLHLPAPPLLARPAPPGPDSAPAD